MYAVPRGLASELPAGALQLLENPSPNPFMNPGHLSRRLAAMLFLGLATTATAIPVGWDGGGDGLHWSDPGNWSNNVLPAAGDDVVLGAGTEVLVDGADVQVASLVTSRPLRIAGIGIATQAGLEARAGTLTLAGAHVQGPVTIVGAGLSLSGLASSTSPIVTIGNSTLDGEIPPGLTVVVRGSSRGAHARTTWSSGRTNRGTLRLDSVNAGWSATLAIQGGPLFGATGSNLAVDPGSGGDRALDGDFENHGQMSVGHPTRIAKTGGATWTQADGSVEVADAAYLWLDTGSFLFAGGRVTGRAVVVNGRIEATPGVIEPSTVFVGGYCQLVANLSPSVTFWVQGSSLFQHTTLSLAGDAINRGTLRLQSRDAGWTSSINTGIYRLSNGPTGTVVSGLGSGGVRSLNGVFSNAGRLVAEDDYRLPVSGSYEGAGGSVGGPVQFVSTQLSLPTVPQSPHTLLVDGGDNLLLTDVPAGYTLWIRGGGSGHANLRAPQPVANHGVLHFESIGAGWTSAMELTRTERDVLRNAGDGRIEIATGSNGARSITGDLRNEGSIAVEGGIVLDVQRLDSIQFVQAGGTVAVADGGRLQVRNGTFGFTGGSLSGAVYAAGCRIDVAPTAIASTLFVGRGCTLGSNLAPGVTLRVEGSALFGHCELVTLAGAVNAGLIHCESIGSGWASTIVTDAGATLRNGATGTLTVGTGSGGQRSFAGSLENAGSIAGVGSQNLDFRGTYTSAGGTVGTGVRFLDAALDLAVAPAAATTFELHGGASRLLADSPASATVVVVGSPVGGHANLTLPANFTNHGTLVCVSRGGGWSSGLSSPAGGSVVNAPGARLDFAAGAQGARFVGAPLRNDGVLNAGLSVEFRSGLRNAAGGSITADGGIWDLRESTFANEGILELTAPTTVLRLAGSFSQPPAGVLRINAATTGAGRLNVDLGAVLSGRAEIAHDPAFAPAEGTRFTVLAVQSRSGQFSEVSGLDLAGELAFNTEYSPVALDLVSTVRDAALQPPRIVVPPGDRFAGTGEPVRLAVATTGSPTLAFQWYREQNPIGGATSESLDLGPYSAAIQGNYSVRVSNAAGSVRSGNARVLGLAGSIPLANATRQSPPPVDGDGVRIELFNGIGGGRPPGHDQLAGLSPSGTTLSPEIDFPRPGSIIGVGD